ncbi:MAG: hypothetical protein AAF360_08910 [Pseudomonadota bacterium]
MGEHCFEAKPLDSVPPSKALEVRSDLSPGAAARTPSDARSPVGLRGCGMVHALNGDPDDVPSDPGAFTRFGALEGEAAGVPENTDPGLSAAQVSPIRPRETDVFNGPTLTAACPKPHRMSGDAERSGHALRKDAA